MLPIFLQQETVGEEEEKGGEKTKILELKFRGLISFDSREP